MLDKIAAGLFSAGQRDYLAPTGGFDAGSLPHPDHQLCDRQCG